MKIEIMVEDLCYSMAPTKKPLHGDFSHTIRMEVKPEHIGVPFKNIVDEYFKEVHGIEFDSYSLWVQPKVFKSKYKPGTEFEQLNDEYDIFIYQNNGYHFTILRKDSVPENGIRYTLHEYIGEYMSYPSGCKKFCIEKSAELKSGPSGMLYFIGGEEVTKAFNRLFPDIALTEEDDIKYGDDATGCFEYLSVMKWHMENNGKVFLSDPEISDCVPIKRYLEKKLNGDWKELKQLWNDKRAA